MQSIWEETAGQGSFPPLEQDTIIDVLIIGGGICGLLCGWLAFRSRERVGARFMGHRRCCRDVGSDAVGIG